MNISKLFRLVLAWTVLAIANSGAALAASAEVYDGMNFDQFKAILSKTNLVLEERTTQKGNRYFVISASGMTVTFLATTADCNDGQVDCSGYSYLANPPVAMDAATMTKFNVNVPFVKATPAIDEPTQTFIRGQNYARGGVTAEQVVSAAAFFALVLQDYVNKSTPTAMNAPNAFVAQAMRQPVRGDEFFRALAARSPARPAYIANVRAPAMEAFVDATNRGLK